MCVREGYMETRHSACEEGGGLEERGQLPFIPFFFHRRAPPRCQTSVRCPRAVRHSALQPRMACVGWGVVWSSSRAHAFQVMASGGSLRSGAK